MPKTNNLVVFGNPPYQSEDGGHGKSAKPIYHLFVEAVIDSLNPRYLSFIIPSRWMAGGKGLDDHRTRMMKDKRMRSIKHFSGQTEVFHEVSITGGVNYFLWDREYNGKCNFNGMHRYLDEYDIVVSDNKAVSILDKIRSSHSAESFMDRKCLSSKPFGLRAAFEDWQDKGVPCYLRGKEIKFVDPTCFTDSNNVRDLWKVCLSEADGNSRVNPDSEGKLSYAANFFVAEPGSICLETYVVVNAFKTKSEAENFVSYMKTKFFRFMLGIRVVTQHVNKDKFAFVPDLGDYSKPVTDAELYKKFGLSEEEIAYIESKIKAL